MSTFTFTFVVTNSIFTVVLTTSSITLDSLISASDSEQTESNNRHTHAYVTICTHLCHSHSLSSRGDIRRCLVPCMCDCGHNHSKELHIKKGVWFTMHDIVTSVYYCCNLRVWHMDPVKPVGHLHLYGATQTCQDWQLQIAARMIVMKELSVKFKY